MTRDEVIKWLESRGYGLTPLSKKGGTKNLYFVHPEKPGLRYSVSTVAIRRESRQDDGTWFRLRSGYFKKINVNEKNQLVGLT
jgi:hypothetical protein